MIRIRMVTVSNLGPELNTGHKFFLSQHLQSVIHNILTFHAIKSTQSKKFIKEPKNEKVQKYRYKAIRYLRNTSI